MTTVVIKRGYPECVSRNHDGFFHVARMRPEKKNVFFHVAQIRSSLFRVTQRAPQGGELAHIPKRFFINLINIKLIHPIIVSECTNF